MAQQYYMSGAVDTFGHHSPGMTISPAPRTHGFRTSSRKQPTQSVPSTPQYESYAEDMVCRTATVAAVNAWITGVEPGTPAPLSPKDASYAGYSYRSGHRDPSPSGSDSRSSASSSSHNLAHHAIPSSGYGPIVVAFPHGAPTTTSPVPQAPRESGRHRTLSLKPTKSRSKATVDVLEPRAQKEKKEKKSKQVDMDAILAADLAMAQLLGGGTIQHHARQQEKARAKNAESARVLSDNRRPSTSSQDSGLDDVPYRSRRSDRGREHHRPAPLNLDPSVPIDIPAEPKKTGKLKGFFSAVTGKKSTRA